MKNYVKIILHAYPFLKTVDKDYEEHIKNRALLSYDGSWTAEQTAEYLAGEILNMRRLEWLKKTLEEVLQKLTDVERTLTEIRYFGKGRMLKGFLQKQKNPFTKRAWTERSYFRYQERLGDKIASLLVLEGITEEVYERELASIDVLQKIEQMMKRRGRYELKARQGQINPPFHRADGAAVLG